MNLHCSEWRNTVGAHIVLKGQFISESSGGYIAVTA